MRAVATAQGLYGPRFGVVTGPQTQLALPKTVTGGSSVAQPSAAVPVTVLFGNLSHSVIGQPFIWLFGFVLFLVAWKLVEEHRGGEEAFEKMRVDGSNLLKATFMVLIGFAIVRFLSARYFVPGLSPFVQYATGSQPPTQTS